MDYKANRNINYVGPTDLNKDFKQKEPSEIAAGTKGVYQALSHTYKSMGIYKANKALLDMNQKEKFDCASCAWPDPDHPSPVAEYCENGAKALADENVDAIDQSIFVKKTVKELSDLTDYELNRLGRITKPMILRPESDKYEVCTWDEAYDVIIDGFQSLDHPDEAAFYTSGRASNEAAFLYGTLARAFGTNNMPDCSNMCHETTGHSLARTLGIGKGSAKLSDLYESDLVLVVGQNPGTNHPRMLSALQKCRSNGGKVVSINPLYEAGFKRFKNPQKANGWLGKGSEISSQHLSIKINRDLHLFKALLKRLITEDPQVIDKAYVDKYTTGYSAMVDGLKAYNYEELIAETGLSLSEVDKLYNQIRDAKTIIICWAMGITQHANAVETIQEMVNLLLVKGCVGRPGTGTFPVRGHSNVQGNRSVGIKHFYDPAYNARFKEAFGLDAPDKKGHGTVESIEAMYEGDVKLFMCLGGNFVSAASDTIYTGKAVQNCDTTVFLSTKFNRTHLCGGKTSVILPCLNRSEKDIQDGKLQYGTIETSTGRVRRSRGTVQPAHQDVRSEPLIMCEIGDRLFGSENIPWQLMSKDYNLIRMYIDKVAAGFENTTERSKDMGYYLPNNCRELDFSKLPEGKAQITVNELSYESKEDDGYLLMTIRTHDQFNTTIYGLQDRYRGIHNERRVILMNADDMKAEGFANNDKIDLSSSYQGKERIAYNFRVLSYDIPQGNLAGYFPETNCLIPIEQHNKHTGTPISKSVKVKLKKRN